MKVFYHIGNVLNISLLECISMRQPLNDHCVVLTFSELPQPHNWGVRTIIDLSSFSHVNYNFCPFFQLFLHKASTGLGLKLRRVTLMQDPQLSLNRPTGPIQSISRDVCDDVVCLSVCLSTPVTTKWRGMQTSSQRGSSINSANENKKCIILLVIGQKNTFCASWESCKGELMKPTLCQFLLYL